MSACSVVFCPGAIFRWLHLEILSWPLSTFAPLPASSSASSSRSENNEAPGPAEPVFLRGARETDHAPPGGQAVGEDRGAGGAAPIRPARNATERQAVNFRRGAHVTPGTVKDRFQVARKVTTCLSPFTLRTSGLRPR